MALAVTTPKVLKIKKSLLDLIARAETGICSDSTYRHKTALFLLGQNKVGTIVDCERLAEDAGGCKWVPAISAGEVSRAYMALAHRNRIPGIIGQFFPRDIIEDENKILKKTWYWAFGEDPLLHKGRIFIRIMNGRCMALKTMLSTETVEEIPMKIIG